MRTARAGCSLRDVRTARAGCSLRGVRTARAGCSLRDVRTARAAFYGPLNYFISGSCFESFKQVIILFVVYINTCDSIDSMTYTDICRHTQIERIDLCLHAYA